MQVVLVTICALGVVCHDISVRGDRRFCNLGLAKTLTFARSFFCGRPAKKKSHGGRLGVDPLTQDARNCALEEFKDGSCPTILVATDVAARGLDIPDVEVVLNYTFPLTIVDYVHRIGRTGRGGKSGISPRFFQRGIRVTLVNCSR